MTQLVTDPNIAGVDDIYERLIAMHDGRSVEESLKVSARLNLILINHIGDREVVAQAIALAAGRNQTVG
ncbi:DUF2783 domain-containing protein [Sphingomonas sp. G-3-2-10]|uniref:DUF2783 domain-containing protein n=1 Tax=Sphingomonas sp. G-3-2-10 TaxID=2728838 RepID=UPI00146C9B83|nr:DUF2783 domain-containing protein [Sphingomonas sp. G-3-2-10]NML08456.1 DUF2783 domain-containing protein [Sphingomonas sp. G-3-2-10]